MTKFPLLSSPLFRVDEDDDAPTATGRGDAPSPSGTGERVRARVLRDGAGKVLQNVRLETVERAERVRAEVSRTVHGEIRGRDENDQPSGAETIQPRRRGKHVILERMEERARMKERGFGIGASDE